MAKSKRSRFSVSITFLLVAKLCTTIALEKDGELQGEETSHERVKRVATKGYVRKHIGTPIDPPPDGDYNNKKYQDMLGMMVRDIVNKQYRNGPPRLHTLIITQSKDEVNAHKEAEKTAQQTHDGFYKSENPTWVVQTNLHTGQMSVENRHYVFGRDKKFGHINHLARCERSVDGGCRHTLASLRAGQLNQQGQRPPHVRRNPGLGKPPRPAQKTVRYDQAAADRITMKTVRMMAARERERNDENENNAEEEEAEGEEEAERNDSDDESPGEDKADDGKDNGLGDDDDTDRADGEEDMDTSDN